MTHRNGWRLWSVHCDCVRQERMRMLLSLMERQEEAGEATTPREYGEAMGFSGSKYRIFYAAEREGFIRRILVRKGPRRDMAYVLRDPGRMWLREHEAFLRALKASRIDDSVPRPLNRGGARPCQGMVPMRQIDDRVRRRRQAAIARQRAKLALRRAEARRKG